MVCLGFGSASLGSLVVDTASPPGIPIAAPLPSVLILGPVCNGPEIPRMNVHARPTTEVSLWSVAHVVGEANATDAASTGPHSGG
jgi:hypothetical protein